MSTTIRALFISLSLAQWNGGWSQTRAGTVSMFELGHKLNGNASKQMQNAEKGLAKDHDLKAYIQRVQRAVELDPDFIAARINLATAYLMSGRPSDVLAQTAEVLKRDPDSERALSLSSAADLDLKDFIGAEAAARRALRIDPSDALSRFHLGMSLELQRKEDQEALRELATVEEIFPTAHIFQAGILERSGKKEAARKQLETYLQSGDADMHDTVKRWLAALQ